MSPNQRARWQRTWKFMLPTERNRRLAILRNTSDTDAYRRGNVERKARLAMRVALHGNWKEPVV